MHTHGHTLTRTLARTLSRAHDPNPNPNPDPNPNLNPNPNPNPNPYPNPNPGEGTDLSAPLSLGASVAEQATAWACASPAMTQDGLDSADTTSALAYLRMLSAEPDAAKLRSLHEALDSQPPEP